jgi:hypothetical protein
MDELKTFAKNKSRFKKAKTTFGQGSGSHGTTKTSSPSQTPALQASSLLDFSMDKEASNRFLFRNHEAFTIYEGYSNRKLCNPYFYRRLELGQLGKEINLSNM